MPFEALAVQTRGGEAESVHYGWLVVVNAAGQIVLQRGGADARIYARSALKPVQALPLFLGGAAAGFNLPDESLAVALASHSGEARHQAAVSRLLQLAGVGVEQLQCGTHTPYHEPTARALSLANLPANALHCNCSGKHAAMLAVCRHHGWDMARYREAEHPLQRWIRDLLLELSEANVADVTHAIDGCGVPVWRLPLVGLARSFAKLGSPDQLRHDLRDAAKRIAHLMSAYPHLIAGEGRLDTDLLGATAEALIVKIGGEGVHAGAICGTGLGWAIKVADGNKRALGPVLAKIFAALGRPLPMHAPLEAHTHPVVRNNLGEIVGQLKAAW